MYFCIAIQYCSIATSRAAEMGGGQLGHFALGPTLLMGPKRSIYSNSKVKYSIKAVTTYILPWAPQALSAALATSPHSTLLARFSHEICESITVVSLKF